MVKGSFDFIGMNHYTTNYYKDDPTNPGIGWFDDQKNIATPYGPDGNASISLDGGYFGPTFPHMMMLSKPQLLPPKTNDSYIPRVFGFRVG